MMTRHAPLLAGIVVGLSVAVPIGPMALLCIQRTLASGLRAGLCTGLGAATVNVVYGALILAGLDRAGALVAGGGRWLGVASGVFLLWSAARTWVRRQGLPGAGRTVTLSPGAAYGSAVAFNAANPLSPLLMVALLSPVVAQDAPTLAGAAALLCGVLAAAAAWWACLTGAVSLLRGRLTGRVLEVVNQVAAALLTLYGAMALARSAGL